MAYILIDAYNLIGIAHRDLEKARDVLIKKLYEYSKSKNHNITIVFDGWRSGRKNETRTTMGNLSIIYSKLGKTADTVIKEILSVPSKPWIVVSSDRDVTDYTEKKDFVAITSDEFDRKLNSLLHGAELTRSENIQDEDEDLDVSHSRHKGNPRQLSRKEKKKIQALKKL